MPSAAEKKALAAEKKAQKEALAAEKAAHEEDPLAANLAAASANLAAASEVVQPTLWCHSGENAFADTLAEDSQPVEVEDSQVPRMSPDGQPRDSLEALPHPRPNLQI